MEKIINFFFPTLFYLALVRIPPPCLALEKEVFRVLKRFLLFLFSTIFLLGVSIASCLALEKKVCVCFACSPGINGKRDKLQTHTKYTTKGGKITPERSLTSSSNGTRHDTHIRVAH